MEYIGSIKEEPKKGYKSLNGKEIERVVLGSFAHEEFLKLRNLHLSLGTSIAGIIDLLDDKIFENSPISRDDLKILFDEEFEMFFPVDYKKNMTNIEDNIEALEKEIKRLKKLEKTGSAVATETYKKLEKRLDINLRARKVYATLKNALRENHFIKKIIKEMITLQEGFELRCDFSKSLIGAFETALSRRGFEILKISYATMLHENPDVITWPDFFGIDSAVRYEVKKEGKVYRGDFLIDATKDSEKNNSGKVGGRGIDSSKIIVPCQEIDNDIDLINIGRETGIYLAELIDVQAKAA